jgi:hypothetical protein
MKLAVSAISSMLIAAAWYRERQRLGRIPNPEKWSQPLTQIIG